MNKRHLRISVQMMILFLFLFFIFNITNPNISLAYVDITGNVSEYLTFLDDAPIQGIRIQLTDTETDESLPPTLTDKTGHYTIPDVPEGNYKLEFRYGDINIMNEFQNSNLVDDLTIQDILKYNGHDYIVSDSEEQTTNEYKKLDKNAAQIFFVIDTSGSMDSPMQNGDNNDSEGATRLDVVKEAAKELSKSILDKNKELNNDDEHPSDEENDGSTSSSDSELNNNNIYVGLVSFNSTATVALDASTSYVTQDSEVINREIDKLQTDGSTNVSIALLKAQEIMDHNNVDGIKIIIFLSDGLPTENDSAVYTAMDSLNDSNIKLYSLLIVDDALGLDELDNVADLSEEEFKESIEYDEKRDSPFSTSSRARRKYGTPYISTYDNSYSYIGYLYHLYELYHDADKMVFKENAKDLVNCMTEDIQSWIEEKITEFENNSKNSRNYNELQDLYPDEFYETERGWEDENRRDLVDGYFSRGFHNNVTTAGDNISEKLYLFKALENIEDVSEDDIKELSEHTYMTITLDDINIEDTTTEETINLRLKRRKEFSLRISNKAIGLKVTLNTGRVLHNEVIDDDDIHIFLESLDPEFVHGALIEIEYKVTVENLSKGIDCTYLELASYLPNGLLLSTYQPLISNPKTTNYDNGWRLAKKSNLVKSGYITHNNFDLLNRHIATFSKNIALKGGETYTTNFVVSCCIDDLDNINYYNKDVVEIIGYKNSKNRRMEFKNEIPEEYTSISGISQYKKTFYGIYPGDGKPDDPDYALDLNSEFVIPPTGKINNIYITIIYFIVILMDIVFVFSIKYNK